MLFEWNEDTIRRYRDAEAYEGFYAKVAETILPRIAGCRSLCDLGCGLGLADFVFCRHLEKVTCVDKNPVVLRAIEEQAKAENIANIETLEADARALAGAWDVFYMSFFGTDLIEELRPRCKKLFAVVSEGDEATLYPKKYQTFKKPTVQGEAKKLREAGIPFALIPLSLPFGQPLSSHQDAVAYVRGFAAEASDGELETFLAARLVKTEDPRFPYYMPRQKSVGIFEIPGDLA